MCPDASHCLLVSDVGTFGANQPPGTNMPLNDAFCRALKPKAKPYKVSDSAGLHILVRPNGSRLWRWSYRFAGKQKTLAFGAYPAVGLADARRRRDAARDVLAQGLDPANGPAASPHTPSFETVAREWHESQKHGWVPTHSQRVMSRLERDVFPAIGLKPVSDIQAPDILALLREVEKRGALDIAKRLRQSIGAIFRYAIATGRASRDPAADLKGALMAPKKPQHHASLKAGEIADFYARLLAYDGEAETRLALEFIMHTFVRTAEARFARWEEFDLTPGREQWRIPAARMKMGRDHVVPLTPSTLALLEQLRGRSEWVFPGSRGRPMSANTMIYALYRMGYHSRLTVHGLRGTASTILNESGRFEPDWIERQLAHVEGNKVRAAYNAAQWLPQRRAMMEWWSQYLEGQKSIAKLI